MNANVRRLAGRLLLAGAVGGVLLIGGTSAYRRLYAEPMGKARADLTRFREASRAYEAELDAAPGVRGRLRAIAATTLGATEERVAHRFRSLLHELGTSAGLTQIVVSEGRTAPAVSPAQRSNLVEFRGQRNALQAADFVVMQGEVRGVGTLENVARTLALAQSQEWVHRVVQFSVSPLGDERRLFDVRVSVATLILPDLGPGDGVELGVLSAPAEVEGTWGPIVSRNVFKMPASVVVQASSSPPPPPPPPPPAAHVEPPPPYHHWRLAGVMQGASGVSVVMVDQSSGQSRTLGVGDSVLDATLVGAAGESAAFAVGGEEWTLGLGQTLAERRRVDRSGNL